MGTPEETLVPIYLQIWKLRKELKKLERELAEHGETCIDEDELYKTKGEGNVLSYV